MLGRRRGAAYGAQFKESLRDGRAVWVGGRRVDDVTEEPVLGPGIDLLAEMFDAQLDPGLAGRHDVHRRGGRPRQPGVAGVRERSEDCATRRKLIEYTTLKTVGQRSGARPTSRR